MLPSMRQCAVGSQPVISFSADDARKLMCATLVKLGFDFEFACSFGTHSLRRGHADDLRRRRATKSNVQHAGQWSSDACKQYVDLTNADHDFVAEAHGCDSESDSSLDAD